MIRLAWAILILSFVVDGLSFVGYLPFGTDSVVGIGGTFVFIALMVWALTKKAY